MAIIWLLHGYYMVNDVVNDVVNILLIMVNDVVDDVVNMWLIYLIYC